MIPLCEHKYLWCTEGLTLYSRNVAPFSTAVNGFSLILVFLFRFTFLFSFVLAYVFLFSFVLAYVFLFSFVFSDFFIRSFFLLYFMIRHFFVFFPFAFLRIFSLYCCFSRRLLFSDSKTQDYKDLASENKLLESSY